MKRFLMNLQIRTILFIMLLLFSFMAIVIGSLFIMMSYQSKIDSGYDEFTATAQTQYHFLDQAVGRAEVNLLEIAYGQNLYEYLSQSDQSIRLLKLPWLDSIYNLFVLSNPSTVGMAFLDADGHRVLRSESSMMFELMYAIDKNTHYLSTSEIKSTVVTIVPNGYNSGAYCILSYPVFLLANSSANKVFLGSVVALLSIDRLLSQSSISMGLKPNSVVIKVQDEIYTQARDENWPISAETVLNKPNGYIGRIDYGFHQGIFFFSGRIARLGIGIGIVKLKGDILRDLDSLTIKNGLIMLSVIIVYSVIVRVLIKTISHSLAVVTDGINKVNANDISHRIECDYNNEIYQIAASINGMLDQLEEMTQRIIGIRESLHKAEISKIKANLRFYAAQIQPHFIYNTLECIRSIAEDHKITTIGTITGSISAILRYSLKDVTYISISEELGCLNDYVNIIEIRYQQKINLKVKCDENLFQAQCIKMILQPLVENCVFHGFSDSNRTWRILVKIYSCKDMINIIVADNGDGISPDKLKAIQEDLVQQNNGGEEAAEFNNSPNTALSIGLANIRHRVKLHYGKRANLTVSSQQGYYTVIKVQLPLNQ